MRASTRGARSGTRAFTMVEVLLAIGIFSFVLIAIYSCWSAIMRGTRVALTAAAEVQRTRVAVKSLEEALAGAVMYSDNSMYYGFFAYTADEFAYLSFVARLPESFPGSGLFPGHPLRRVTFRVDENKNLLLSQSTLLDISESPYTITLAPKTAVFQMEFFNPRMNEWIPDWMATNALPTLVRVALDFGDRKSTDAITIRSIPLTASPIARIGAVGGQRRGGLRGGGDSGEIEVPQWTPPGSLPPGFYDQLPSTPGNTRPPNPAFPR